MTTYSIEAAGNCLGEWLRSGSQLVADTEAEIRSLDLVSIVFGHGEGPWARWMRSTGEESRAACKLFLGRLEAPGVVMVGQLNPPVASLIPEAEIVALHRIVGIERAGGAKLSENDRAAFALVAPFARRGTMRPINPDWRPAERGGESRQGVRRGAGGVNVGANGPLGAFPSVRSAE